jgi:hypothetical protein
MKIDDTPKLCLRQYVNLSSVQCFNHRNEDEVETEFSIAAEKRSRIILFLFKEYQEVIGRKLDDK